MKVLTFVGLIEIKEDIVDSSGYGNDSKLNVFLLKTVRCILNFNLICPHIYRIHKTIQIKVRTT